MSSPTKTRDQAMRKRRLRITIDVDVPAKGWNRRKLNQAATALGTTAATAFRDLEGEIVYLATEEREV